MEIVLLLLLAILPGLGISYYIFKADKYEPENKLDVLVAFLLGVLITFPVYKLEELGSMVSFGADYHVLETLFFSFIVVALTEEVFKASVLLLHSFRRPFFNEPMDGIVYAVMIAMGFATTENVLYSIQSVDTTTMLVRMFTAVPAHASFAIIMGYFVGAAKFSGKRKRKLIVQGLVMAVLFHGTYDFFILLELYDWLTGLALVALVVSIIYARKLIKLHQENSPFRHAPKNEETET